MFERTTQAHGVEPEKCAAILVPHLTGKAQVAYTAMSDEDAQDYEKVKVAIFQCYDINEETYRWWFCTVKPKENKTPVELAIQA